MLSHNINRAEQRPSWLRRQISKIDEGLPNAPAHIKNHLLRRRAVLTDELKRLES